MSATTTSDLRYTLYIRATPEQVWDAITKPEYTTQYFYGSAIESTFETGAPYVSAAGEMSFAEGEILEAEPGKRLSHTWRTLWVPEAAAEQPSRVTWKIEPQGDPTTKLTLVHDRLDNAPATVASVEGGWSYILSGLKTVLETGAPLA
jgi:uncharacterized protein YndB with AHSA1/START domain